MNNYKPSLYRFALCLILLVLTACTQLQPRPELPVSTAIPLANDGYLDRLFGSVEAQRPTESAFRLLIDGTEAFVTRVRGARTATRSIDVQTYIWRADDTGLYLALQLLEAADRGVKVRLLLDDMDARVKNAGLAAMAAHPNIEVRMFNPFASRVGTFGMLGEAMGNFARVNRRMHNKSWIFDNRIAVVGGRNVGDEYFSASDEVNFVDLDFAMIGPIVRDASASFDKYWNSSSAYPMETLDSDGVSAAALDTLRGKLMTRARATESGRYAAVLHDDDTLKRYIAGDWPMEWSAHYAFVSDDPNKVTMQQRDVQRAQVGGALLTAVEAAQTDITIISPYFVPSDNNTRFFTSAAQSGKQVRILTNSLVANDVAAVHGGYSRQRKPLLAGGVQLWEMKPAASSIRHSSLLGSSGASLHTKALSVDKHILFVGSFNIDPRSTWLNCEQGVLVDNAVLTAQLDDIFAAQTAAKHAWKVSLKDGELHWSDGAENFNSDPQASIGRRFQAWLTRALHLDAQL